MNNCERLKRQGRIFNHSGECGKIVTGPRSRTRDPREHGRASTSDVLPASVQVLSSPHGQSPAGQIQGTNPETPARQNGGSPLRRSAPAPSDALYPLAKRGGLILVTGSDPEKPDPFRGGKRGEVRGPKAEGGGTSPKMIRGNS